MATGCWLLAAGCWLLVAGRYKHRKLERIVSYKNLEIWKLAREVAVEIHKMTLENLPKFEMHEIGSQIRRSSKSVKSNIVEGYGRKNYQKDYLRFMTYSISSNDETIDHLETLWETNSLKNEILYNDLHEKLVRLGKQINCFIQSLKN